MTETGNRLETRLQMTDCASEEWHTFDHKRVAIVTDTVVEFNQGVWYVIPES